MPFFSPFAFARTVALGVVHNVEQVGRAVLAGSLCGSFVLVLLGVAFV